MRLPLILLALAAGATACRPEPAPGGGESAGSAPGAPALTRAASLQRVNAGARGMIGQLRWAYSPDSSALLAVEDWASIEAEPFFDGFRVASERFGRIVGRDSVWDAAPSPDWTRVAYGAALILHAGESETTSAATLEAAARRLGVSAEEARASQFSASGMGPAAGWARLGIMDLGSGEAHPLTSLTGWRVRWNRDGSRVFGGLGPTMVQDDSPSTIWVSMTPSGDSAVQWTGAAPLDTATVSWITGPTLDVSVTPDSSAVTLTRAGHTVTSASDTVRVDDRVLGPGIAVAATRHGCYVLALVQDSAAREFDPRWRAAIYDAGCARPAAP
ncbi:MAG TPA: hypothetical protein VFO96_13010 [Gemmatimonadales bacterium]|jgi:hypothetical protein|nr:hypothetical protein [Gemmatimonadales bacterium]